MEKALLKNFVPFPRSVFADRQSGKMSPGEYDVYVLLRHRANPFGIAYITIEGLCAELYERGWTKNTVNKLLLSLKEKRYLYYARRAGRKGSFAIKFPEFLTSDGVITTVPAMGNERAARAVRIASPEASPRSDDQNPRSDSQETNEFKQISKFVVREVRASYTETESRKLNNRFFSKPPESFTPTSHEEEVCREIALAVGESSMDFLLGSLHEHGFSVIEKTWGIYKHDVLDKGAINNKGAYFNTILQNLLKEKGGDV
jgi:hypothetical protein